jgi:hypothetical protein
MTFISKQRARSPGKAANQVKFQTTRAIARRWNAKLFSIVPSEQTVPGLCSKTEMRARIALDPFC